MWALCDMSRAHNGRKGHVMGHMSFHGHVLIKASFRSCGTFPGSRALKVKFITQFSEVSVRWYYCLVKYQSCYAPGLILCASVYLYLYSAIYVSCLTYMYHQTALPPISDISAISIFSCFRFTDVSRLTCLFGPHFPRLRCPFDSYLPLLFRAHVSHFYSYNSNLFCSLLSTILRISQPIPSFFTHFLSLLWLVLYMTLGN